VQFRPRIVRSHKIKKKKKKGCESDELRPVDARTASLGINRKVPPGVAWWYRADRDDEHSVATRSPQHGVRPSLRVFPADGRPTPQRGTARAPSELLKQDGLRSPKRHWSLEPEIARPQADLRGFPASPVDLLSTPSVRACPPPTQPVAEPPFPISNKAGFGFSSQLAGPRPRVGSPAARLPPKGVRISPQIPIIDAYIRKVSCM